MAHIRRKLAYSDRFRVLMGGGLRGFSTLSIRKGAGDSTEIEVIKGVPDPGEIVTRGRVDNHGEEDDTSRFHSSQRDAFHGGMELERSSRTAGSLSQNVMSSFRRIDNHKTMTDEF
jgi:hypothetical protein